MVCSAFLVLSLYAKCLRKDKRGGGGGEGVLENVIKVFVDLLVGVLIIEMHEVV